MATSMAIAQTLTEPASAVVNAARATSSTASLPAGGSGAEARASRRGDPRRAWIWWFLVLLVASQLYFVRELVAAFALFAVGFVMIAAVVASLYFLTKASQLVVERLAELRHPAVAIAPAPCEQRKAA